MSEPVISKPSPSTTLQTETELSLLYRILRTVIKPLKPRLVKPGKPLPAGSPQLTSHPKSKNKCTITEHRHPQTGIWQYDFKPQSQTQSTRQPTTPSHLILYFAGGGFQSPPSTEHWGLISKLASSQLSTNYTFRIVSYPLAPNSPASTSLPVLQKYLLSILEECQSQNRPLSLMGDSAGANVALSLGFWWAETFSKENISSSNKNMLRNIILISPPVDHRNSNPEIKKVDHQDPILGFELIESVSEAWCSAPPDDEPSRSSSRSDPTISPLLNTPASYRLLKEMDIKVHGVIGTADVLGPDAELFRRKCVEFDVEGDWLVWEGQMHCFVLACVYGLREGRRGYEWVRNVLEKNV